MNEYIPVSPTFVTLARREGFASKQVQAELEAEFFADDSRLAAALHSFCELDRGTIVDGSVVLDDGGDGFTLEPDGTGSVALVFQEEAYYGCKDADTADDHHETITFRVDLDAATILIEVPDVSQRDYE